MSRRTATGRLMGWEQLGTRSWGLGVAADILSQEERLAKLESHAARCPMGIDCPGPADEVNGGGDMTDHWTELNLRMERAFQNQRLASEARSLRDHFAAAALTGLLSQCAAEDREAAETAAAAMRYADAMLRERGNHSETPNSSPNLDAAPAAIANAESVAPQPTARGESDRNDKAAPRPSAGTGDTPAAHATRGEGSERREGTEPEAWAVMLADGERIYDVYATEEEAKAIDEAVTGNHGVVPLYRKPPLTDAEREAISVAYGMMNERAAKLQERIATLEAARPFIQWARALQGLFERLGGGR